MNPCLPIGSNIEFDSWMHMNKDAQFYPRSDPRSTPYSVTMVGNNQTNFDFEDCSQHTYSLLRKETNTDWCDFQMDGNCGFAGIYQPPMPQVNSNIDEFIATSNFVDVYQFLQLGERASVSKIGKAAEHVCGLDWNQLKDYNANLEKPITTDLTLAQFCFRSVFVYQLLRNGWGFGDDFELTALAVIGDQKMGWALGCMLYEINTRKYPYITSNTIVQLPFRIFEYILKSIILLLLFSSSLEFPSRIVVQRTQLVRDRSVHRRRYFD